MAIVAPAFRQLGGTMAAAISKRRRFALAIEKQNDFLAEQSERLGSIPEHVDRHGRVPEAGQDLLLGAEHGCFLPWNSRCEMHGLAGQSGQDSRHPLDVYDSHAPVPTSLSCHAPSASLDRPTMMVNRPTPASVIRRSAANMRGMSSW